MKMTVFDLGREESQAFYKPCNSVSACLHSRCNELRTLARHPALRVAGGVAPACISIFVLHGLSSFPGSFLLSMAWESLS